MGSLVKFTSDGVVEWQRVADLGCASAFGSVAADDDAVYVHGGMQVERNDNFVTVTFVRAYTHDGTALWTYEDTVGGPEGFLENLSITDRSIAVDENGVYALSQTGAQALVRRFDFNGEPGLVPVGAISGFGGESPVTLAVGDDELFVAFAQEIQPTGGRILR